MAERLVGVRVNDRLNFLRGEGEEESLSLCFVGVMVVGADVDEVAARGGGPVADVVPVAEGELSNR